ncbi:hypothetical protein DPMN_176579 [Dreissena polymorpha]|uniref:Uncharacterized protein n=1 Tax=Dreissena polymorpha TaxID=45954 RepID=A0A9D4E9R0_DREPO|nr:hypothetical protein DPMN_176579 [Dreissena polymorpha]
MASGFSNNCHAFSSHAANKVTYDSLRDPSQPSLKDLLKVVYVVDVTTFTYSSA